MLVKLMYVDNKVFLRNEISPINAKVPPKAANTLAKVLNNLAHVRVITIKRSSVIVLK